MNRYIDNQGNLITSTKTIKDLRVLTLADYKIELAKIHRARKKA